MGDTATTFEARIERLVASGAGLARVEGRVVFVAGAVPGDLVRARVVRSAKRHDEAVVEELLEPSPDRRVARCAHFGTCGGCALQHLAYPAQLAAKRALVLDALRSVAGVVPEFEVEVLGSPEYGWRARAEFQVASTGTKRGPGGFRVRSHEVEAVHECPVLVPELENALRELDGGARPIPEDARTIHLAAGDAKTAVVYSDEKGKVIGNELEIRQNVAGFDFTLGARGFFQANRALLPQLVERATAGPHGSLAFDLYAGSGLFSLPLARRFDLVMAVEEDKAAAARLGVNARRAGRTGVQAHASEVSRWLGLARRLGPDFVLLDPPRAGAGPGVVDALVASGAAEIRYVSCDPATLARDLRGFLPRGYRLEGLVVLDLFPQTLHVEAIATLKRVVVA
ncbi:MAG: class I SAM-dependent RNA methyltransferase [Planctomycetota bacterium]|nr:class I SAM-dependent RNA methyltransferase [Planctomycetota bacterium]